MNIEFKIKRGNPFVASARITDLAYEPINLIGCKVLFTATRLTNRGSDESAEIKAEMIISDAINGMTYLRLTSEDTGAAPAGLYKCDIRVYRQDIIQENTDEFYVRVENVITTRIL